MTYPYHTQYTKNENPCEFSFVKQCVNLLSSAVDRREVLGVAVGEWSDIVFLQCGTQVRLPVEHLARPRRHRR